MSKGSDSHPPLATLCLRFDAPMQSWGTSSRFERRDTAREPTKSGVVGLLAAAVGIPREDGAALTELADLRMGVRVEREGDVERDFHTTGNVPDTEGGGHRTALSDRYYLAGALFLVAIEGEPARLNSLHRSLRRPHWPVYFGRKAFVPSRPVVARDVESAMRPTSLDEVLATHRWLETETEALGQSRRALAAGQPLHLRTVTDCRSDCADAELRHDYPVSFVHGERRHGPRHVRTKHVPITAPLLGEALAGPSHAHDAERLSEPQADTGPNTRRPVHEDHDPFAVLEL